MLRLVEESLELYADKVSVEVITESAQQKTALDAEFAVACVPPFMIVLPTLAEYWTPKGTQVKARALHYMVELRRQGFNRKPGWTFIVHSDEESVMAPSELRKLVYYLATSGARLSEGPIFYPLEYFDVSLPCRAMEVNRPLGCYECRQLMESGTPLHMHGSNLVIDEALALGFPCVVLSLFYLLYQGWLVLIGRHFLALPLPVMAWLALIGFMWLNSLVIGSWHNLSSILGLSHRQRWIETMKTLSVAPSAGVVETVAGFWAVMRWLAGYRQVSWIPTPKTKVADRSLVPQRSGT